MTLLEKINKVAYELYEKNGRQEGNELLNWLAAEKIVHFEQMISPEIDGSAISLLEYKPLKKSNRVSPSLKKQGVRSQRPPM
jgi:hypothetical protein